MTLGAYQPAPMSRGELSSSRSRCMRVHSMFTTTSPCLYMIHATIFALSILSGALVARLEVKCPPWHTSLVHDCRPPNPPVQLEAPTNKAPVSSFQLPVYPAHYEYEEVRFAGAVNAKSPFKGPPTAAVDKAWEELWAANMVVSAESYKAAHPQYPEAGVKAANRPEDQYYATFEATHQLHCLYTLFRASYVDYYEPERKFLLHDPDRYHARLDHCTDMLRQKLMCDSDSGIVTYKWIRNEDQPVADYSVLHHCRNHELLLAWSERNAAAGVTFNKSLSKKILDLEM